MPTENSTHAHAPSRLANLPWSKLPVHRLRGSVWDSLGGETSGLDLSMSQLQESFAVQETPSRSSTNSRRSSSASRPRPARTTLLEPKRASSIGIMLGSWRLQPGEIRTAILKHDVAVLPSGRTVKVLLEPIH